MSEEKRGVSPSARNRRNTFAILLYIYINIYINININMKKIIHICYNMYMSAGACVCVRMWIVVQGVPWRTLKKINRIISTRNRYPIASHLLEPLIAKKVPSLFAKFPFFSAFQSFRVYHRRARHVPPFILYFRILTLIQREEWIVVERSRIARMHRQPTISIMMPMMIMHDAFSMPTPCSCDRTRAHNTYAYVYWYKIHRYDLIYCRYTIYI